MVQGHVGLRFSRAVAPLVEDFLAEKVSPETRRVYRRTLWELLAEVESVEQLALIDHRIVAAWRNWLVDGGNAPATVNRKLAVIRGFFDFLIALELIGRNPAGSRMVRGFRLSGESKTKGLSAEEARRLVAVCDDGTTVGLRDRAIVLLGLVQGLRRGEIAALRFGSLGIEEETWVLLLRGTKTSDFNRQRLDPRVLEALERYAVALPGRLRREDPLLWSRPRRPAPLVWSPRALTGAAVNNIVKRRARQAGLRGISAHSLRHTCATLALDAGVKLERVQAHLRHRDPRTTLRYYRNMHALRSDVGDAIRLEDDERGPAAGVAGSGTLSARSTS